MFSRYPFTAGLESTASELAEAAARAYGGTWFGHEGSAVAEVRAIGQRLGATGGGRTIPEVRACPAARVISAALREGRIRRPVWVGSELSRGKGVAG